MNQTEKRRQKLLEQTRKLYIDRRNVPAVHPRYKASYYQIYSDDMQEFKSTIGFRIVISIVLLAGFILMKSNNIEVFGINDLQVLETIMHNYQIKLY